MIQLTGLSQDDHAYALLSVTCVISQGAARDNCAHRFGGRARPTYGYAAALPTPAEFPLLVH